MAGGAGWLPRRAVTCHVFDAPEDRALAASATFTWHAEPADFTPGESTGEAVMTHLLEFSALHWNAPLRVFTTLQQYTPDTVEWRRFAAAHQPISVSLTTASFVDSDLPDDGGPFSGQTLTFTVE